MNLKEILDQLGEKKASVAKWESIMDYRTQIGRENAIRAAKGEIQALEAQYWQQITDTAIFFLATGGDAARCHDFKLAAEQQGGVCVDAEAVYKGIADRARQYMGPSRTQMTVRAQLYIVSELQALANRYNLSTSIPQFPPEYMNAFVKEDEVVNVVRRAAETTRVPLNFLAARTAVLQEAVNQQVADEPVAFVVYGIPSATLAQKSFLVQRSPAVIVNLDEQKPVENLLAAAVNEAKKLLVPAVSVAKPA